MNGKVCESQASASVNRLKVAVDKTRDEWD